MVLAFLKQGADPNVTVYADHEQEEATQHLSLLHGAVWHGEADVVRCLLERGANKESRNFEGLTPLLRDSIRKSRAILWLLEYGADPNSLTPKGESALHLCSRKSGNEWDLLSSKAHAIMLLKYGADPNLLTPGRQRH